MVSRGVGELVDPFVFGSSSEAAMEYALAGGMEFYLLVMLASVLILLSGH